MRTHRMIGLKFGLVFAFALAVNNAWAGMIDFNSFADGTSVSSISPLNGILSISATGSARHFDDSTEIWQTSDALIAGGILAVAPNYSPDADDYRGDMTAIFSAPVTNVSFQLENWRTAGYSYTGIDGTGATFQVASYLWGAIENGGDLSWTTITLDLPLGGYITGFSVRNRDPNPGDAAFWIDNIGYDTDPAVVGSTALEVGYNAVPDAGPTFAMIGGALAWFVLLFSFCGKLTAGWRRR